MLHKTDGHEGGTPVQEADPAELLATSLLSVPEAARRAGVSTRVIRRAIQDGALPATRDGRVYLISEDALATYASTTAQEVAGEAQAAAQPALALVPFPSP